MIGEYFDATGLAEFYRDLAEKGGEIQVLHPSGEWIKAMGSPCLDDKAAKWRIYRKPVPREWWINQYPPENDSHEFIVHQSMESADMSAYAREERIRCIHVREVIE